MKSVLISIFFFFSSLSYAQSYCEINKKIGLTDSLSNKFELRVYRKASLSNKEEIIQLYINSQGKSICTQFIINNINGEVDSNNLTSDNKYDSIWCAIIKSELLHLPAMSEIQYKFKTIKINKSSKGKYTIETNDVIIHDGIDYFAQIKISDNFNEVSYQNPEELLKYYPEVDELMYFSKLLYILRTEFNIWNENYVNHD